MPKLKGDLRYVNKQKIEDITEKAIDNKIILDELVEISLANDVYISQHAALIVQSVAKENPEIIAPYLSKIISTIPNINNDSQLGNFIEILELVEADCSKIHDYCFDLIENSNKPGYVKIYSIKMLGIAAKKDEKLKLRVIEFIETRQDKFTSIYLKKKL